MYRLFALTLRRLFGFLIIWFKNGCDVLVVLSPKYVASGFAGYVVHN